MRGSCNSNKIVSAATSRIASDTRARRCCFMIRSRRSGTVVPGVLCNNPHQSLRSWWGLVSNFHFRIDELGNRMCLERVHDFTKRFLERMRLVADDGEAEDDHLAIVVGFDLSDRHVERLPQAILDAVEHLAFVF